MIFTLLLTEEEAGGFFTGSQCMVNCLKNIFHVQKELSFFSLQNRLTEIPCIKKNMEFLGEQGWRSGESACLPPMWAGFDSWTQRHMWVEFVVGSLLCSERFFSGYSGFPLSSKNQHFQILIRSWNAPAFLNEFL